SAGERQRIALARALLRNPSILIMDEPTAALDSSSEAFVSRTLATTLRGRTIILITHRLSLVETADFAAVLVDGPLIQAGVPRVLLACSDSQLSRQFRITSVNIPRVEAAQP